MWDHTTEEHDGNKGEEDYMMVKHSTDRDPMRRILREAVRIQKAGDGTVVKKYQ